MNFTVSGDVFYQHVSMVNRIMASRNSLPILDCILLNLRGNELEMVASDSDNTMQTKMNVVSSDGDVSVAVTARLIIDAFKNFSGKDVTLSVNQSSENPNNYQISIVCGSFKSSFIGMDPSAFPLPTQIEGDAHSFSIQPSHFASAISSTLFAVATEVSRPVLQGLQMEVIGDKLRVTGTDSYKLSEIEVPVSSSNGDSVVVLPPKGCQLLKSVLAKEGEDVIVMYDSTNIQIALGDSVITVRQVEGKYPNVRNAIPTDCTKNVVIPRMDFIRSLQRLSPFQDQSTLLVMLKVSSNSIQLKSYDSIQGLDSEDMISCTLTGEEFEIGFKSKYLLDIISNFDTEEITLDVALLNRGVLLCPVYAPAAQTDENSETPSTATNYERLCLLMPVQNVSY